MYAFDVCLLDFQPRIRAFAPQRSSVHNEALHRDRHHSGWWGDRSASPPAPLLRLSKRYVHTYLHCVASACLTLPFNPCVCMYGWTDGWLDGCMNVRMYGCMDAWMYGCMFVRRYACICIYVYMYVCMYVCMCIHIHIYICICLSTPSFQTIIHTCMGRDFHLLASSQ